MEKSDILKRIQEEGQEAFKALLNDYSEEELLRYEEFLEPWQIATLKEQMRKALLACEMKAGDDDRCNACDSFITGKDSPFCCECGSKNDNFDPALFPNMEMRVAEECAKGHPSPLMDLQVGDVGPSDFYCYLCGVQLLKQGTVPYAPE